MMEVNKDSRKTFGNSVTSITLRKSFIKLFFDIILPAKNFFVSCLPPADKSRKNNLSAIGTFFVL